MSPTYRHPRPMVTVDVVVMAMPRERLEVLLIKRKRPPFRGRWAIPGGFIEMREELEDAARRELAEETGVAAGDLLPFGVFAAPGRDPRGRTVSVAYLALCADLPPPVAGDDAAEAEWFALDSLPPLAFDHVEVLREARQSLRELAEREVAVFGLLPRHFTMARLRGLYQQILGQELDPQRFRRRMLGSGVLERSSRREGAAILYRLSRRASNRAAPAPFLRPYTS